MVSMPHDRYFLDQSFTTQDHVTIEDAELRHMHVMRAQAGDTVELVNGKGQLAHGSILDLQKKRAHIQIKKIEEKTEFNKLVLAQGLCRLNKLDWILEKATELGVTHFWIFVADKSEKKQLSSHQLKRLKQITISALKQCSRLTLPEIRFFESLEELPSLEGKRLFGDVRPSAPPLHKLYREKSDVIFCVGPEKGFSNEELSTLAKKNFEPTWLNANTLRTETAAIAAMSILANV